MKLNEKSRTKSLRILIISFCCAVMLLSLIQGSSAMAQGAARGGRGGVGFGGGRGGQMATPADGKFAVTVQEAANGSVKLNPALPEDGRVAAGTVLTLTATPDEGYVLDCSYHSGLGGGMFAANVEYPDPEIKITVDKNMTIGASFIKVSEVTNLNIINNVNYAKPGKKQLKYDVFSPKGVKNLPCIVIIHGGGWTSNCEDVMRGLGRELAKDGKYVAISIDYRWAQTVDGDEKPNTMANLIEDCYGAIAHIQEHASEYSVDPTRLAVTGDSAGGHLSAAVINMVDMIGDEGFGVKPGVFQYKPTYMPKDKTVEQVRKEITAAIKAAAPSYGVFANLNTYSNDPAADRSWTEAVSPINHIPDVKDRAVPQFLTRGTNDSLIRHENVQAYAEALKAKGQIVEYLQPEGASHAFFDWKVDTRTKATFAQYGVPYAAKMKDFFDTVYYPKK
ncbi:MAG: alpha/beta hydrolase [Sedimentisphaerales bacterium]|nr:alpha/beta hydrolase [Sedimentisphaerales bacterium]